ncbi:MAG: B12-binding domain-containing radical SAM protein [Chitinophagales bacterium]
MKKILFTHSYFLRLDPKQWQTARPYAPLGTLHAASVLRENEYDVFLFDTMFARDPIEILGAINQYKPDYLVIYDDGFNYLTKMCLTNMREAAMTMIREAKGRNCCVIVSSSDAADHYEKYLKAGADFVLIGEAELTLLELIQSMDHQETDLISIKGLAFMRADAVVKTAPRPLMRDLDALPMPAWDLVDIEPYRRMWLKSNGYFSMNMATTRGCPFKCNWCAKPIYGNRYNSRSPAHVVRELKFLKENYRFDHIWFCDDIFGLKPGWVNEFANRLESEDIKFRFKIQARADLLLEENNILALARAGCENVWMGAESGSQKILDAMDKGIRVEEIFEATRLLKKHGIQPSFFIQFGYPGEDKEDIQKTIRMINKLLPYEIGISVSYPLPGTAFYEKVKSDLQHKANWSDSDELQLMFRNTYQPAFYKQLHRYVHKSYRKHIGLENLKNLIIHPLAMTPRMIKKVLSLAYYFPAAALARHQLNTLEKAPI